MNKKVLGATITEYDGIKFLSRLECSTYKKLKDLGIPFTYQGEKFYLMESFHMHKISLLQIVKSGIIDWDDRKIRAVTYTPDFCITVQLEKPLKIYMETKGKANDAYPIKKKLFLKRLEEDDSGIDYIFMEPHTPKQVDKCMKVIKAYHELSGRNK